MVTRGKRRRERPDDSAKLTQAGLQVKRGASLAETREAIENIGPLTGASNRWL